MFQRFLAVVILLLLFKCILEGNY